MVKINLKDISDVVTKYSKLLSSILKLDVEVVDSNFERIAGTGIYEHGIGKNIESEGYVYKAALLSGKSQVIENPGENILCQNCKDKGKCKEEMEICVPIKYGNDTFGVIGFVCSTKEQKEYLLSNFQTIMSFLEQVADFISIKIIEQNEVLKNQNDLEFLEQIINSVENGIIAINNSNKINLINNQGMKILKLNPSIIGEIIEIEDTEDYLPSGNTYKLYIKDKEYIIVGRVIHNYINVEICSQILVFNEIKKINEDAVILTHGNNKITCDAIVGESQVIKQMKEKIRRIAYSKSTVLITGESGTGKELVARAIHSEGNTKNKPFIAINCGAIPESLLESELFGYVKGAFSGASTSGRVGKFELANKGVIFLDEIGDMPIYLQVKLLRVLQERTLEKIGSNQLIDLDIRVIAATNKDLKKLVEEGKFREDLYYRLNVIPFEIPPLRDREGDIELIMNKLIKKYNKIFNKYVHSVNKDVIFKIKEYPWNGNVRELENLVEFMVNISNEDGIINMDMLPKTIANYIKNEHIKIDDQSNDNKEIKKLRDVEMEYIEKILDLCGRDTVGKKEAAKKLGIGIATLYRKIDEK